MLGTADDDYQLATEETHGRLREGLKAGGIAIADGLEGACTFDLEGQLVIGIRNEVALGIGQGDGDKGKVFAVGLQLSASLCPSFQLQLGRFAGSADSLFSSDITITSVYRIIRWHYRLVQQFRLYLCT